MSLVDDKLISLEAAAQKSEALKGAGKKVVTTNGSFDILHPAHVHVLQEAKKQGDVLFVLLNSDASVKANKGENRPIVKEEDRAFMLAGLGCVDYIVLFDDPKVLGTLDVMKPSVHVKGGTYEFERIKEEVELVEQHGGKHLCLPEVPGYSTTSIIETIIDRYE